MPIPMEVVTLLGSTGVGAIVKLIAAKSQAAQDQHKMLMERAGFTEASQKAARGWGGKYVAWTRRTIALTVIFSVFLAPLVGLLLGLPVIYGVPSAEGWIWTKETVTWFTLWGIPITPIHSHMAASIGGLYFGSSRA